MGLDWHHSLVENSLVHSFCRFFGSFFCVKFDLAISSGLPLIIESHTCMQNFSEFFKGFFKLFLVDTVRQVADMNSEGRPLTATFTLFCLGLTSLDSKALLLTRILFRHLLTLSSTLIVIISILPDTLWLEDIKLVRWFWKSVEACVWNFKPILKQRMLLS